MYWSLLSVFLALLVLAGCANSIDTSCDDSEVAYSFSAGDRQNYVFGNNVVRYEGYLELRPIMPTKQEIARADSVISAEQPVKSGFVFVRYGGFVSKAGERVVAANYVYRDSREYPRARCSWFNGLGRYFENNTQQRYVNLNEKTTVELW